MADVLHPDSMCHGASLQELYLTRVSTVFGGGRERRRHRSSIVVDFVAACQAEQYREVERFSLSPIQEMPVHVADLFGGPS